MIIKNLFIIVLSCIFLTSIVVADNGVWHRAEDVKPGIFGSDENVDRKKLQDLFLDKEILDMDNVIFTPHNAFNSNEAVQRIQDTAIENILDFAIKNQVKYPVIK